MFCPNCGTQNSDEANACQRCGFKIKGTQAPKFKGTVLMMNPQASGQPSPVAAPSASVPPPAPPQESEVGPTGTAAVPKARMKGTMIGVAPPGVGIPQPVAANPAPAPSPPGIDHGAPAPGVRINPLGGTMVADPNAIAGLGVAGAYGQQAPIPPQGVAQEGNPATLRGQNVAANPGYNPQAATVAFGAAPHTPQMQQPTAQQPAYGQGGYAQGSYDPGNYGQPQGFPGAPNPYGSAPAPWSQAPITKQAAATNPALWWLLAIVTLGIYPLVLWIRRRQ